jgi:hypothetical protein
MTACVAHHDLCSGEIKFYFVEVEKLNGEDAILVDDEELQTISEINGDRWNDEVVRVLRGETRSNHWLELEMTNILKERFSFLK